MAELKHAAGLPYREIGRGEGDPVVLLHGFPESSRMWVPLMEALAASGRRCIAPDLYGLGASDASAPTAFEDVLEAFTAFMDELGVGRVALVVHDWGGFVGLAWACDHPERITALVVSDAGFFSDGKWHGAAEAIRGPDGEALVAAIDREGFAALLGSFGDAFDDADVEAYWAPFEDDGRGQRATLGFYRSMDFEKLEPWQGKLGEIGAPALILWGADDPFAPLAGARRLQREIPGSKLVAFEGVGHFVFDEATERSIEEVRSFLG